MPVISKPTFRAEAGSASLDKAVSILHGEGLVAFPTETVYGLGADATNPKAVAKIFEAKGRPRFNPLISHVTGLPAAQELGRFDASALELAETFWPGPLTLVVPVADGSPVCDLARAGLDSIAIRVPSHPTARALLAAFGKPVVAPSANRSGHVSPTLARHVLDDLDGRIDMVLDGGAAGMGLESTVVSCLGAQPRILRPGGVTRQMIERVIGPLGDDLETDNRAPIAPGQLSSHYAPRASLRLDAAGPRPHEAWLSFGPCGEHALVKPGSLNLSASGDLVEAAANLYAMLRQLDAAGPKAIAVAPIPADGMGEAIRDRLKRAAAPRQSVAGVSLEM